MGRDTGGRTIIQLAVDDHTLETLLTFEADATELEDQGDDEPDADDEISDSPLSGDLVRPTVTRQMGALRHAATAPAKPVRLRLATSFDGEARNSKCTLSSSPLPEGRL